MLHLNAIFIVFQPPKCHCNSLRAERCLDPPPSKEFIRSGHIFSPHILTEILPKTIIGARSIVRSIKMIMEKEVDRFDARNFTIMVSIQVADY